MKRQEHKELTVILHGIGMNRLRMAYLEFALRRGGFDTLNLAYPSLTRNIEECAKDVARQIETRRNKGHEKIHFVAHSMGCLVTLELMAQGAVKNIVRTVLIAPPYRGSEVADLLAQNFFYRHLFGPAGQQLTTAYRSKIDYGLPPGTEIGVIAGTRAYEYPLFLSTMKKTGLHDGLVSVESTKIPGIKEHITIRMSHSFLLEKSASETVHFLTHGRFSTKDAPKES